MLFYFANGFLEIFSHGWFFRPLGEGAKKEPKVDFYCQANYWETTSNNVSWVVEFQVVYKNHYEKKLTKSLCFGFD
jgi:hypothetical protein